MKSILQIVWNGFQCWGMGSNRYIDLSENKDGVIIVLFLFEPMKKKLIIHISIHRECLV